MRKELLRQAACNFMDKSFTEIKMVHQLYSAFSSNNMASS